MNYIKSAVVYKCELPDAVALDRLLAEQEFTELDKTQYCKSGFIANADGEFVQQLPEVLSFVVRYDEKIIPKSLQNSSGDSRLAEFEEAEGRPATRKEKTVIKEEVFRDLVARALSRERRVTCFYNQRDRFLIVPTASRGLSGTVITNLTKAVGSVSTTTLHIDSIKQSTTEKLKSYLQGDYDALDPFSVGGSCKLKVAIKGQKDKSMSFNVSDLEEATKGVMEAISSSAKVTELGLSNSTVSFRLTEDFTFKGISFHEDSEEDYESDAERFRAEAPAQVFVFSEVIKQLLTLFEYKEQVE